MIPITNAAGAPHITPKQDAMFHRGIAGADSCVYNFFESFEPEVSSNQKIKVRSGIGQLQGRLFCVEPSTYDEIQIANGTQGEKRIDLIVARWTVNEEKNTQTADWAVIQGESTTGTPAAPDYTDGDLDAGDTVADMPMYEVSLDGINVTGITKRFTVLAGVKKAMNIPSNALKFLTGNGNGDTPTNWGKAGPGMAYISTEGMLTNQPMKYGWLMNYTAGGSVVAQQFVGLDGNSPVWYRSGNASGWYPGSKGWVKSLDEKNGMQMETVWTNPSPTSAFANQKLDLDLSDYDLVMILFKLDANGRVTPPSIVPIGNPGINAYGTNARYFLVHTQDITFDSVNPSPSVMIPYKIYGIKGAK